MRKSFFFLAILFLIGQRAPGAEQFQPMPVPLSNNAVAAVRIHGQLLIYSMMGLGANKSWNSVTNATYALNTRYDTWTAVKPVPGPGRLGAAALALKEQIFLFGGYVPDPSGNETIVNDLSIYEPITLRWYRGAEMPVGVRDAVAGAYRERYIYIVGGLTKAGPTNRVQVYDSEADKWFEATPSPGAPVFGHAGSIVNDTIVYLNGAIKNANPQPAYEAAEECWLGKIDRHDPKKIQWNRLPPQPTGGRYRIAAGSSEKEQKIYFAGGSPAIYDFNGMALDGKPAQPASAVFAFNVKTSAWEVIADRLPHPTMDQRGLVVTSSGLILVGGMSAAQQVINTVTVLPKTK